MPIIEFDRFNNHTAENKENYDLIIFGRFAEVLEVELNELQSILGSRISNILRELGNGILGDLYENFDIKFLAGGNEVSYNGGQTTIPVIANGIKITTKKEVVINTNGYIFQLKPGIKIAEFSYLLNQIEGYTSNKDDLGNYNIAPGRLLEYLETKIWINYSLKDMTSSSQIYEYGWRGEGSKQIDNHILDLREGEETSRRRVLEWIISIDNSERDNYNSSAPLKLDFRYNISLDSQRYIINSIKSLTSRVETIEAEYVQIKKFDSYLKPATETRLGVVKYADKTSIAQRSGDGVVRAKDLSQISDNAAILNLIYPVGAILMTSENSFSPNTLYAPQVWERVQSGRYIITNDSYSTPNAERTYVRRANLPAEKLSINAATHTAGGHLHQVGDHAHLVPDHKHIVPWGNLSYYDDRSEPYPWGSPLAEWKAAGRPPGAWDPFNRGLPYTGVGSGGGLDYDNEWMYTSPQSVWTHGSAPLTNTTGEHAHTVYGTTDNLGQGAALDIKLPELKVIVWRRVK